jgi:ATP-dependent Lhr-like helicase
MSELELEKRKNQVINALLITKFTSLGFNKLTEIQQRAIPKILEKKNSLITAPTGSGKTECSVIPIFSQIKKSKSPGKIKALYITPLRALNRDVHRRIINYAKIEGLDIKIRHGDTSQTERKKISDSPPDVLITTPETLVVLLSQRKYLSALSDLEWVVIDEIHELLASERGSQLSISMERLQLNSNQEIHRIGLSATVGNISEAGKFLVGNNRKCEIIRDKSIRKYDVNIKFVDGGIHEVADGIIDYVNEMKIHSPVLLFTNSRGESETLASVLKERTKIKIDLHHGSLSRQVREETETILRDGTPGIVVCTSSLELGLDLGSIDLVIHYGSPRQVSKFMQRIGRSKHNRDSSAKGLIITNHADDEFETNAIMQRIEESSIEEQKIHDLPFGVLAHHLVGLTKQVGDVSVETAFKMIKQSYPFRNLTIEEFLTVLETLASEYLIFFDREKMSFWDSRGRSFRYHFENLSTIPDILKYKVIDITSKKFVGTLDQRFVGSYGESGNIFVLRGLQWSILNIDKKSLKVNVEPFAGKSKVPYWEGENIPVDYGTANKVGKLRTEVKKGLVKFTNKIISELNFDITPDEKTIVVESVRTEDEIVLHACFGTKINSTLSTLLSALLSSTLGYRVEARSDAYRICLSSKKRISEKDLINELTADFDIHSIMTTALKNTNDMNWKTWCVAKQFSVVERGAAYTTKAANIIYKQFEDGPIVREALRELFHGKFDLINTESILTKIKNKEIPIVWVETNKFSSLAYPILDNTTKSFPSPVNIDKSILDLVRKRLAKTQHRLVCARCGIWQKLTTPEDIPNPLRCKYCKGRQITATYFSDLDLQKIIQKNHSGKKLSQDEVHKYKRAWKISSLLENFGKTALIVLSGYGVGADTAARILRNMTDDENLCKQIMTAEKQYALTRGFWDD